METKTTKTTKTIELVKQYSTKDQVIIPVCTGEYIPENANLVETEDDWYYQCGSVGFSTAIIIKDSELLTTFDDLRNLLIKALEGPIMDDDFYDYLPDLYDMIQFTARSLSIKLGTGEEGFLSTMKPIDELYINSGEEDEDGNTLFEQCTRVTEEMFRELNPNFGE